MAFVPQSGTPHVIPRRGTVRRNAKNRRPPDEIGTGFGLRYRAEPLTRPSADGHPLPEGEGWVSSGAVLLATIPQAARARHVRPSMAGEGLDGPPSGAPQRCLPAASQTGALDGPVERLMRHRETPHRRVSTFREQCSGAGNRSQRLTNRVLLHISYLHPPRQRLRRPVAMSSNVPVKRRFVCKRWTIGRADESSSGTPWSGPRRPNSDRSRFLLPSLPWLGFFA